MDEKRKKLIIFADYGLDDAAATATVLSSGRYHLEDITLVPIGGNVPADYSFKNCITLTNLLVGEGEKIKVVDTRGIEQPCEYLADIHGNDGMGDEFQADARQDKAEIVPFEQWIEGASGDETVLSLGPMTLVKVFLERYPKCSLVIMGGCVRQEPNFNGYEFNQALDVSAFAFCAKHPHAAITLDTCRVPRLDMRRFEIKGDDVHSRVLRADQRLSITRGEDGCYVWDDVAACYLLYPERFVLEEMTDRQGNLLRCARYVWEGKELYFQKDQG